MKKTIHFFLSVCMLVVLIFPNITAKAVDTPTFKVSATQSDTNVTVKVLLDGNVSDAGGIFLKISYDEKVFSYTVGSRKLLLNTISTSNLNRESSANGTLYFTADSSTPFAVEGEIVSFQFSILNMNAGETSFDLEIIEFYHCDSQLTSVSLATNTASSVIALSDEDVRQVIDLIDAIGTVSLEKEANILAAREAYNALSVIEKRKVTNFHTLTEAETELAKLKAHANDTEDNNAYLAFWAKNDKILNTTVDALTLEDADSVNAALEDYEAQAVSVKIKLNAEKNHLNRLSVRLQELEKIKEDELYEQQLKEEAAELSKEFLETWKNILSVQTSEVTYDFLDGIMQAIGSADSKAMINSYFMDCIATEYEHLLALKDAAENYVKNEDNTDAAVAKFKGNFGYLLNMKPEDATRTEEADVRAAILFYEILGESAKESLGKDTLSKLMALLSAIEALPVDGSGVNADKEVVYKDRIVEKIIEKIVGGEDETAWVNISSEGISDIVWYLLYTLLATTSLSVIAALMYLYLRRRYKKIISERSGDNEE